MNPVPNELRPDSTSRDPPELIAPVCDCLWHPRRRQGFPMPNKFTLVSTSRESPEYIAPVCDCLWHHHRLPGSLVPNELRPDLTSRESPEFIAPVCDCFWQYYDGRWVVCYTCTISHNVTSGSSMLDDVTARHEKRGHAIKRGSRHLKRLKLLLCFYFLNYILWYRGNNQY